MKASLIAAGLVFFFPSAGTARRLTSAPGDHLFSLGEGLVRATVLRRPSLRNKSPYVGDVILSNGRVAMAHMPSLDMGGKCSEGAECLLRRQVDKTTGLPLGPNVIGKFGKPKCEFIMQLIKVVEPENDALFGGPACWVGAHPSLGEKAAYALMANEAVQLELTGGMGIESVLREVTGVAGTDMRCDFLLTHKGGAGQTVVEVKTVVDTDYDPKLTLPGRFKDKKCIFLGKGKVYERAAIFPWGKSKQKGPDGEKVVSSRAIKHLRELTSIARGDRALDDGKALGATVLFIVVRHDAKSFRPNEEACPSFARYLREAKDAGVRVLAHRVRWGDSEGEELGIAIDDGSIPVTM